ncbi:MAG: hypothetical protein L6V93_08855 [Clostridiales bacterium]|nr:MAG: hypothetical protein L6V93_08855 [Clostridiales bacterium]
MEAYLRKKVTRASLRADFTHFTMTEEKLIGRAVTAAYCPFRPDFDEVVKDIGRSEGRTGTYNQWVIDNLMEYDVPVIDMYDKNLQGHILGRKSYNRAQKNKTKKRERRCSNLGRCARYRADEKKLKTHRFTTEELTPHRYATLL